MGRKARWIRLLLAGMLFLSPATGAWAVNLYFETVPTESNAGCPEPCYRIEMFIEDPTRAVEVWALQFDVDILGGGSLADLPSRHDEPNPNSSDGIVQLVLDDVGLSVPWNLTSSLGRSPMPGWDVLVLAATDTPFDVKSLAALFGAATGCAPSARCPFVEAALAASRVYLGRFNMTLTGDPFFRIGGISGLGPAVENPTYGLVRFNNNIMSCQGSVCRSDEGHSPVPEPAVLLLLGAALLGLAAARRKLLRADAGLVVAFWLAAGLAAAEPPPLIQYQGILLAPDGTPRIGPVDLELSLFDAPTQGNELYRERHASVPLVDGSFTVLIGAGLDRVPSVLTADVFKGPGTRWLQVRVNGELLVPRQQFLSVPYSFESASSGSLEGRTLAEVVEGPSPLAGYEQVSAVFLAASADATCPAGKVVVGGGCDCAGATSESRPVGGYNSWHCECAAAGANRAWVLCAAAGGPVCGNGVRDSGEQCDSASAGGCADGRCAEGCRCACGNGLLEAPEQCDGPAANACAGGRCTADCRCACGNGSLDAGEQCDGSAGTCPAGSGGCRSDCACRVCGDGVLDPGEQCDGSASACANGVCGSGCRCTCGNGAIDPGEQCDGTALGSCPAGSTGCSGACACVRCGDDVCADTETATSCPGDCTRSYRVCDEDRDCDFGLYCGSGRVCTDSCFRTCDLDPAFEESCSSSAAIGFCIAHCRLDSPTSTYVCPADLVCSNPLSGGNCVAPGP